MTLIISSVFTYDEDAGNYIQAVEAADGQALEPATRKAINNFVIGCKQDGIWNAIKASCILAGARTLNGALVPLVGVAPTRQGTEGGWSYNRKTGLKANGTDNYLNSKRAMSADPQNNRHIGLWISEYSTQYGAYIGVTNDSGANIFSLIRGTLGSECALVSSSVTSAMPSTALGFYAVARSSASSIVARANKTSANMSNASGNVNYASEHYIFADNYPPPSPRHFVNGRISFYSIGESLDLALLDARVTDLINAIGAAF